jgi:hypothetical protein
VLQHPARFNTSEGTGLPTITGGYEPERLHSEDNERSSQTGFVLELAVKRPFEDAFHVVKIRLRSNSVIWRDRNEKSETGLGWQFLATRAHALPAREATEAVTVAVHWFEIVFVILIRECRERRISGFPILSRQCQSRAFP